MQARMHGEMQAQFQLSTLLGVCINFHVQSLDAAGSKANLGRPG